MREALRDTLPTFFACLVLLDGLFACRRHADSNVAFCRDGGGRFFFSTDPHSSHKARGCTPRPRPKKGPKKNLAEFLV
jgi:hypothetical protein